MAVAVAVPGPNVLHVPRLTRLKGGRRKKKKKQAPMQRGDYTSVLEIGIDATWTCSAEPKKRGGGGHRSTTTVQTSAASHHGLIGIETGTPKISHESNHLPFVSGDE